MSDLVKKTFHGIQISSFDDEDGVVWADFVAVLKALGHLDNESLTDATRRETAKAIWFALDEDERKEIEVESVAGDIRVRRFVNEPGMYHIATKFDTAMSRSFRRWVTHELVPAYRKGELVRRDIEATGRELAVQIQSIGTALVEAFDRIDKVEEKTNQHEVAIQELRRDRGDLQEKVSRLSGEAEYVTVRTRMMALGIGNRDIQKNAMNVGGACRKLAIERSLSLPPKVVEGTYQVNLYPYELIDEVLRNMGLCG